MVPDRQKVRTDGRMDGMDGRTDNAQYDQVISCICYDVVCYNRNALHYSSR